MSLSKKFESKSFLYGLSYLVNIFGHINNSNRVILGPGVTIMNAAETERVLAQVVSLEM